MSYNYQYYTNTDRTPVTPVTPGYYQIASQGLPNQQVSNQIPNQISNQALNQIPNQIQFMTPHQITYTNQNSNLNQINSYQLINGALYQISPSNINMNMFPLSQGPETTPSQSQNQNQNQNQNQDTTVNFPINQLSSNMVIPLHIYNLLIGIYSSIQMKKYATSAINPSRNYLTVYEYTVNNQSIIWDYETGFVHLTAIWKAAEFNPNFKSYNLDDKYTNSKTKADIVKLLESTPKQYQNHIKRIRGGFLKIQGTWLPYKLCKILARRFCYYIRYELIPLFGNDFPDYCFRPSDKKFGELRFDEIEIEADKFDVVEASKCLQALSKPKSCDTIVKPIINTTFRVNPQNLKVNTSTSAGVSTGVGLEPPIRFTPSNSTSIDHKRSRSSDHPFDPLTPKTPTAYQSKFSNYTTSPTSNPMPTPSVNDGINSILLAADLTNNELTANSTPPNKTRRISIKINDLLT